jgi:hypothetical protein
MRSRELRLFGVFIIVLAVSAIGAAAAQATPYFAGPLSLASKTPSPFAGCTQIGPGETNYVNAEVEPWVEVNPTNPANIIGVFQQDRWSDGGARGLVAAVTHNGGSTWNETWAHFTYCSGGNAANGGDFERASDPWVTFSPNGAAYQIAINFNSSDFVNAVEVSRSANGGDTWSEPTTLIRDSGERDSSFAFHDKESITADPFNSNYVYAIWDRLTSPGNKSQASLQGLIHSHVFFGPTWLSRTTNGGASWEPARMIFQAGAHNQTIGNQIVVLPSGDLVDVFTEFVEHKNAHNIRGAHIAVTRSTDKGVTWSKPIVIAELGTIGVTDPETGEPIRTGDIIPDIAVNLNATTPGYGDLYVVWQDARFSGFTHDDIALSRSTNGGLTWSAPVKVNLTPSGAPAFTASVHVASNGIVGVTYYDFRNDTPDPATLWTDYFLAHSHNRGVTFGDETQLTVAPFDMKTAPFAGGYFVGDYEGLANIGTTFIPFFVQANTGNAANRTDAFERTAGP